MKYEVKTYELNGKENGALIAAVEGYDPKYHLPILDVPMMSDEKWNEKSREMTLKHYRELSGMGEAPDYETALKWEQEYFGLDKVEKNPSEIQRLTY